MLTMSVTGLLISALRGVRAGDQCADGVAHVLPGDHVAHHHPASCRLVASQRKSRRMVMALCRGGLRVGGRVPEVIRTPALNAGGVLLPIVAMVYWLWRLRGKRPLRGIVRVSAHAGSVTTQATSQKPLRLWPAVVIAIVQLLVMFGAPLVAPDAGPIGMLGGVVGALAIAVWWLFFSRAPWFERVGAIVLMIVAVLRGQDRRPRIDRRGWAGDVDPHPADAVPRPCSRRVGGGHTSSPGRSSACVVGGGHPARVRAVCAHPNGWYQRRRRFGVPLAVDADSRGTAAGPGRRRAEAARRRSTPSAAPAEIPKETPTVRASEPPAAAPATASSREDRSRRSGGQTKTPAEWPGFRGPGRDSVIRGVRIETDWTKSPPVAIWRRPIGPGWSSFAVHGDLLYTQEQRGEDEVVSCYRVSTGEPVWRHRDAVRFYESNGGAGPRATPTLSHGRVYTLGATAVLNALDAGNGKVVWSRNAATDTGRKIPGVGHHELAAGGRRPRDRRRVRHARRVRRRHRQAALGRSSARRDLQLAAAGDDRRSRRRSCC